MLLDSAHVKAHRCAAGGKGGSVPRPFGISGGGRTTKIHALGDGLGRPLALTLTPGQAADCRAAEFLLRNLPPGALLTADRAYHTDAVRGQSQARGSVPNIPPKRDRRWKHCSSPVLYRGRDAVERVFGRLKDFRRIATHYDKLASNFWDAGLLAATAQEVSQPDS